jgi:Doubled CXXCH motif (Paired_CXXCH_1)
MSATVRLGVAACIFAIGVLGAGLRAQEVPECALCHGELEFLRQHVATLAEARTLLVPRETLGASAHGTMECSDCHENYRDYPHLATGGTASCAACHQRADSALASGMHGDEASEVTCASCHGIHDVRATGSFETRQDSAAANAVCASCHPDFAAEPADAHEDVLCSSCHAPHATLAAAVPGSRIHRSRQAATCGTCHDSVSAVWAVDAHGTAAGWTAAVRPERDGPDCVACHGAHPTARTESVDFNAAVTGRCATCHPKHSETFLDSYHGQAASLGRSDVAQCAACHTAHEIYPASDARSTVSEARRLETCRSCHAEAAARFTEFEPHVDPRDPGGDPRVFWTYRFMSILLVGVFGVFGLHSALWLGRSAVVALRRAPWPADRGDTP